MQTLQKISKQDAILQIMNYTDCYQKEKTKNWFNERKIRRKNSEKIFLRLEPKHTAI